MGPLRLRNWSANYPNHNWQEQPESKFESLDTPLNEEFVQLFSRSQRRIYLYILSQVQNAVDAEEILQEANIVIWRKCQQFQPGSNFLAWASQIANYEVLKYRQRIRRDRLYFSEEFIRNVAEDALASADNLERRRQALIYCLGKLKEKDRELIKLRYKPGANGKSVAEILGRPINSVYQSMGRIRRALFECINRRLATEASP